MRVPGCDNVIMTKSTEGRSRLGRPFALPGGDPVPYKPKKPYAHPGCPALTAGRFCDTHAKQDAREYERYRRNPDTHKRYGRAWRRVRERFIASHPLCEECRKVGRLIPAQEVHHILPLSDGGAHDEFNLMSICVSCHSGITLSENNRKMKNG